MPTKIAEAYVSIRANTAALMGDMNAAKGVVGTNAVQMGAAFPAGIGPGVTVAKAQIAGIPRVTAVAATQVKAQTAMMGSSFAAFAKSMAGAMGVMAVGAAFVGGAKKAIDFDSAMIQATSAMEGGDAAAEQLALKARDVGMEWGVGAKKAADAMGFLALAGYSVEESMQGMGEVVKFGIAGNFDAATASDILTDAMSALGHGALQGAEKIEKMREVADSLSRASITANTSVQQMGEAILQKAGAAAAAAKMPMNDLNTMLLIFADKGKKGATAGILASTAIEGLGAAAVRNPGGKLEDAMFDAAGSIRPMPELVAKLTAAYGDLTPKARMVAFENDGIARQAKNAINMLIGTTDAAIKYSGALDNAGGTTDMLANKKMKSLANQLKRIGAMFEDVSIAIIGPLVGALIDVVAPIFKIAVAIGRWSEAHNDLLPRIVKAVAAALALRFLLPMLVVGIFAVSKALTKAMMSNPFTAILSGIFMLIFAFKDAADSGAAWAQPFLAVGKTVWEWLQKLWVKITEVAAVVGEKFLPVWEALKAKVQTVVDFINSLINSFMGMMDGKVSGMKTGWETAWEIMENLVDASVAIWMGIFDLLASAWNDLCLMMEMAWQAMFGESFGEAISGAWGTFMAWIGNMLDMLSLITTNWALTWEYVKEYLYTVFMNMWNAVAGFYELAAIGAAVFLGVIVGVFKGIWDWAKFTFQSIAALVSATFAGMIAVAKEGWKKITFRGNGTTLAKTFKDSFNKEMEAAEVDEVVGFKKRVADEVKRFATPMVDIHNRNKTDRLNKIADSEQRQVEIAGEMIKARDLERAAEDLKEKKLEDVEEVAEAEEEAEEEKKKKAEAKKGDVINPEVGFKGIAEFGRAIQQGLLKKDDKARDDKQAKDIGGIKGLQETNNDIQQQQLDIMKEKEGAGAGLSAPA